MDEPGKYQPGQTIQPSAGGDNPQPDSPQPDPQYQPTEDQPASPPPADPPMPPPAPAPPAAEPTSADSPPEAAPVEGSPGAADTTTDPVDEQSSGDADRQDQGGVPPSTPPPPPTAGNQPPAAAGPPAAPIDGNQNLPPLLSWEASEYVAHEHGPFWLLGMVAGTIAIAALLVLVLKEWLSAAVVVLMMAGLLVYARRSPRILRYGLSELGITVGSRFFPYSDFRSFSIINDQAVYTVELDPLKRFMPRLSIFLDHQQGNSIVDMLEQFLPRADRQPDMLDRLSHKLKV